MGEKDLEYEQTSIPDCNLLTSLSLVPICNAYIFVAQRDPLETPGYHDTQRFFLVEHKPTSIGFQRNHQRAK